MVNNVYDLVTRTMEQEFPGRVAFRWVEDATGTVKEKTYAEYAQDILSLIHISEPTRH